MSKLAVLGALSLLSGCSTSEHTSSVEAALSKCVSVGASADTMLSNPPMDESFGKLPIMRAGGKDETLVRFDLSAIPAAASIASATLKLYISGSGSVAPVNAHRVTVRWDESTTYASFAQHFDPGVVAGFVSTSANVQKSLDVTALVRDWVSAAQPNYGVLLETSSDKKAIFVSREGGTSAQKPQLVVCYSVADDHCSPNPCQNGATCANGASSYTCTCAAGWTGTNCDTPVDNCATNPCEHGGSCASSASGYTCSCSLGYVGTNCETLVDNCAGAPCQNGGTCVNGVGSYTCQCAPGYTGATCGTLVDNCAANPCLNSGSCANGVNTYTCACAAGYSGANCENTVDECAVHPCLNGGTCVDGLNTYTCSCAPGWTGKNCESQIDNCAAHPCLNGGACKSAAGSYSCSCAAGYTGANCEIDINECASQPCLNGGTCIDGVASYACACRLGVGGPNCTEASGDPCNLLTCDAAGACTATPVPDGTFCGGGGVGAYCFAGTCGTTTLDLSVDPEPSYGCSPFTVYAQLSNPPATNAGYVFTGTMTIQLATTLISGSWVQTYVFPVPPSGLVTLAVPRDQIAGSLAISPYMHVQAMYDSTNAYLPGLSNVIPHAALDAPTVVTIKPSIDPMKAGQTFSIQVGVSSLNDAVPTGTVTFYVDNTQVGAVTTLPATGVVDFTVGPLLAGNHSFAADFETTDVCVPGQWESLLLPVAP